MRQPFTIGKNITHFQRISVDRNRPPWHDEVSFVADDLRCDTHPCGKLVAVHAWTRNVIYACVPCMVAELGRLTTIESELATTSDRDTGAVSDTGSTRRPAAATPDGNDGKVDSDGN